MLHILSSLLYEKLQDRLCDKSHCAWISIQLADSTLTVSGVDSPVNLNGVSESCCTLQNPENVPVCGERNRFLWGVCHSSISLIVISILNSSRYQVLTWFLKLIEFLLSITFYRNLHCLICCSKFSSSCFLNWVEQC